MNDRCEVLSKIIADNKLDPKIALLHTSTYKHGDIYLDHKHHNAIELMYVFHGYIYMKVNNHYVKIQKNECMVIFPNTTHSLILKKNEKCRASCIIFSPGNLSKSFNDLDLKEDFSFLYEVLIQQSGYTKIIANHLIRNVIEQMNYCNFRKNEYLKDLLKLYFCELYIYLSEELNNKNFFEKAHEGNQYISKAIKYITSNYGNTISVRDIAHFVQISERHLVRLFKNELNMAVHEYISFLRIEKAKKMLLENKHNITTISLSLGFNSPQHYATMFKKYENIPPSNYRKQLRKRHRL